MRRIKMELPSKEEGDSRCVSLVKVGEVWWCRSKVLGKFCAFRVLMNGMIVANVNVEASEFVQEQFKAFNGYEGYVTYLTDVESLRASLRDMP